MYMTQAARFEREGSTRDGSGQSASLFFGPAADEKGQP
jgi:hypothetical protein